MKLVHPYSHQTLFHLRQGITLLTIMCLVGFCPKREAGMGGKEVKCS